MRDRPRLSNDTDGDSPLAKPNESASMRGHGPEKRRVTGSTDGGKESADQAGSPPIRPGVDPDRRRTSTPEPDQAGGVPTPPQRRTDARSREEQAKLDARQMAEEIRAARSPRPTDATAEPSRRPREPQLGLGARRAGKPEGLDALLEYRDQRLRQERAKRDNGLQELLDYRDERARLEQQRARQAGYDDMRRPGPPEPDEPAEPAQPGTRPPDNQSAAQSAKEISETTGKAEEASGQPDDDGSADGSTTPSAPTDPRVGPHDNDAVEPTDARPGSDGPADGSADTVVPPKLVHAGDDKRTTTDATDGDGIVEVMRSPDIRVLADERRGEFTTYVDDLRANESRTRGVVCDGLEGEFQLRHCGDTEYRLTADETLPRAVWADGLNLDLGLAQDAKHIAAKGSSFYRPDSMPTEHMRRIAEERNDHMLLKYREVIRDGQNPVLGLEIVTNDDRAAAYFAGRMTALEIPGRVVLAREDEHD